MEIMNKENIDKVWVGAITGVLGALTGFVLFGAGFALINGITFGQFVNNIFFGISDFQSRIVTFSMLIDVVLFFIFIRKNYQDFCKGLIAVLVLSVVAVAFLY
jgi:hypothetical protein